VQRIRWQTFLHRVLSPLGLRVTVDNEGLMITADTLALVRKGIGTSLWLDKLDAGDGRIATALNEPTSFSFSEAKLTEVAAELGKQLKINILVDRLALEELGVTPDSPVSISLKDVKLKSALKFILRDLNLTYIIRDEVLWITSQDACEASLDNRIYWFEGTGFTHESINDCVSLIHTTIAPNTWEALGGPSSISSMPKNSRPAIVIATTQVVHEQIENLLESLRQVTFGPELVIEPVQLPKVKQRR